MLLTEKGQLLISFSIIYVIGCKFDKDILTIETCLWSARAGDILHSHASIEKATKLLGYSPKLNVKKALKRPLNGFGIIVTLLQLL